MKTRVELPIIVETTTDEEYINVMEKIEDALMGFPEVIEVEQSMGEEVDDE